jgi:ferredoxin--NADP+ reductase
MPSVITDACVKDDKCVSVCQRKNIHPRKDEVSYAVVKQLFVNPKRCLDCGSCISVCESKAIFPIDELPDDKKHFAELNAAYYRK